MRLRPRPALLAAVGIGLTGAAGALTGVALTAGSAQQQTPTKTVTIQQITGPQGPPGPPGKDGEPGATSCPTGSAFGEVVFPQQGVGPTAIWTCIKD